MERLTGIEELKQRVLFRLTARRGGFPFLPEMGSDLHLVMREKPSAQRAMAEQCVRQALEQEPVTVDGVELEARDERMELTVWLTWQGEKLSVSAPL